ncbi:glycine-rich cell wall structural protein isoform X2 [Scaptodrosophila lebanonensis]|uniref:Glycine-rich cell wall structural protein isoform X2 n=1 Tax=Drosophila lebanonensis TaxID=7225 RepID=A0A6J2T369_DROLE|nr:glycine-rich cell wall structural protein isoform X2 [Scaptodrosophila lebanonensis]
MTTAKIFVGSLPPGCKPEELRRLFTTFGVVVECDVMNRCGFVHMESTDVADAAIGALNGTDFKGQSIVVEPGRPGRKGGGAGGAGGAGNRGQGGNITRRPMQGSAGHVNNGPPAGAGGNFNRGGGGRMGGNNFRGGAAGGSSGVGGSRGQNCSNGNSLGPMRTESQNRQQRNAPYNKGTPPQNTDGPPAFKNKFNQGGAGNKFGGGGGGNFNNSNNRFVGNSTNQFQSWDNNNSGGPGGSNTSAPGGRRNFKNSPSSGFGGNASNTDFHPGSSGGVGTAFGNQRGGGGGSNNVGQDRRGFALPAVDQQQQQMSFGGQQARFGNGHMLPNSNNADNGMFQRNRNNPVMNSGNFQGGRGGLSANRGGFTGRGGFNARRGGAAGGGGAPHNVSQIQGVGFQNRGLTNAKNLNGPNAYHTEFPPLGNQGGGPFNRNRNGPRPNVGANRRY